MNDSINANKRIPSSEIAPSRQTRQQEDEHQEWLLDEALVESFPASDSPAMSLYGPRDTSEPGRSQSGAEHAAQAVPSMECDQCHKQFAETVALSFEGADYVYHFCSADCFDSFTNTAG
ncbi:hypothetical protein [Thiomonas sp. FB-Cd]|uniref:hypothetical protein n=1 Tax=Thiomonas sp. FB-Cd TaxID=1158292 RepID=UPI0012DD51B2|nr:hypothetical protein [Thiomonas sp. FB-Cd]